MPPEGVPNRSMVIHFRDEPLRKGVDLFPELETVLPMLDRARLGIEFFGIGDLVRERFVRVQKQEGMARLSEFIGLLHELASWSDWRQISSNAEPTDEDPTANTRMRRVLDHLTPIWPKSCRCPPCRPSPTWPKAASRATSTSTWAAPSPTSSRGCASPRPARCCRCPTGW
ncbi:hypothetical protein D9M68_879730 [compost metagenome]